MFSYKVLIGLVLLKVLSIEAISQIFSNCIFAKDECPNKEISFWLYKNETRSEPIELNLSKLSAEALQPKLPIKILIHGFIGDRNMPPNEEVRDPLLQTQRAYVISVDYKNLVPLPCYMPWSVYNVRIVGKCLALLIDLLIAHHGYTVDDIHLIGFSLGAQVAGISANFTKHRLKRITGLDPARFGFTEVDKDLRLDSSDADFIDVMHTDPYLFGVLEAVGHADFYVNFPSPVQPGCTFWRDNHYYNCNHFRAPIYYAESVTTKDPFWAVNCGSWSEYLLSNCESYRDVPNAAMGYFVEDSARGSYFLSTNAQKPYSKGSPTKD